jgi:hypothetical protein
MLGVAGAQAQDAPPPATPATTAAPIAAPAPAPTAVTEAPPPAAPPPAEPAPVEAPVAVSAELTPSVAPQEAPPDEDAPAPSPLSVGAWAHLATFLGPGSDPEKIERVGAQGEVDLLFSADLIEGFGLTANLVGEYGNDVPGGNISILDLHGKIAVDDAFNIWIGRMLVPSDRSNFSGFWFAAPWSYPGFYRPGPPTGPRQGPYGRNDGLTVWGQAAGGLFKYYAGAYNLQNTTGTALFSGRLNLSLINPEPGYYHSSTYYGGKDVLAIGIAGQYQKDGSAVPAMGAPPGAEVDDYAEFNADILFEKNFGAGGVLDLEGAFYKYMGDNEGIDFSYFVLASWMTAEKIGVGKIQPLVRLQMQQPTAEDSDAEMIFDAQLGYVIDNYATRFALVWQHIKTGTGMAELSTNTITLGLQLQK